MSLTELMDVESVMSRGESRDLGVDLYVLAFGLGELDKSRYS